MGSESHLSGNIAVHLLCEMINDIVSLCLIAVDEIMTETPHDGY